MAKNMNQTIRGINKLSFSVFCIIAVLSFYSSAFAASASVSVSVAGGSVTATANGSFESCYICDRARDGQCIEGHYTEPTGKTKLSSPDRGTICTLNGSGSASCTGTFDRSEFHGTHTFVASAGDCNGWVSNSQTLTLDNTPALQITDPPDGAVIKAPFDITATVTFKPTLNPIKGTIKLSTNNIGHMGTKECTIEDCTFSYAEMFGPLVDWDTGGPYTLTFTACGGGVCTSDHVMITVDKTPTVKVTNPTNNSVITSPFDIKATVTFKSTLNPIKGTIKLKSNNIGYMGLKECTQEDCAFSYAEQFGSLVDWNTGGPYTLTFTACGGGVCTIDRSTFKICNIKITSFDGTDAVIDPSENNKIKFTGSISESSGRTVTWTIKITSNKTGDTVWTETGSGTIVKKDWNGKDNEGKILDIEKYGHYFQATLTATNGLCEDKKIKPFSVSDLCLLGGGCCKLQVSFGSTAGVTSGNLYHSQTLFNIPNSKLMGDFTLSYNSLDSYNGVLGTGWTHSYNFNLSDNGDDSYTLMESDGGRTVLHKNGDNYIPESSPYPILTKNADGTFLLTQKSGLTYSFDSAGRITAIADRNSNTVAFAYDASNNLGTVTDPSGRAVSLTYDASNRLDTIIDPSGNIHSFTYTGDALTGISTLTPDDITQDWSYTYAANAFMLSKTDPQGYTTTYTYDSKHRATTSTDPEGKTRSITYPAEGTDTTKATTVTEKDGGVWTYKYDTTQVVLTEKIDPQGGTTAYTYDSNRNMLSTTEPGGGTITYTYDESGNMISITDAAGQKTAYTYNSVGQVTTITDSEGKLTQYAYDDNGNLTLLTDPSGVSTQYAYDTKGNMISITSADGQITAFGYDPNNNLSSITDPTGMSTTFGYDNSGNMTSQTDSSGNTTTFEYNSLNQLIRITDPSGNSTSNTYDAKGNRTSVTDANGNTTYYEYNYNNQIIKVTDALGNVTTYIYGGTGCPSCGGGVDKLTSITDANGNKTSYEYDSLGRLTKETDPEGKIIAYAYDASGNLISKTDAAGVTVTYLYDTLNRLTNINYPASVGLSPYSVSYTYDSSGKILTMTDQSGITEYAYDTSNRLIAETKAIDGQILITTYNYNLSGSLSSVSYPDGRTISYNQDSKGEIVNVTSTKEGTTKDVITSISYNTNGTVSNIVYANGINTVKGYDAKGALNSLNIGTLKQLAYVRDAVGNITAINDLLDPSKTKTYVYDKLYRLTQATMGTVPGTISYTYDPVGNRETETTGAGATNYAYGAGNKLVSSAGVKNFAFGYDNNGNTTSDNQKQYAYNQNQRLMKAVEGSKVLGEYVYNANGQRVKKTVSGKTTYFIYDQSGNLIEEIDNEGKPTADYIYLGSTPIARFDMNKDNQPPVTTVTIGSPSYQSFISAASLISLTANDEGNPPSGVDYTEYRVDDEALWTKYLTPFSLSSLSDGAHTVHYRSVDKAANIEDVKTLEVTLDKTASASSMVIGAPQYQAVIGGSTPITIIALDSGSGVSAIEYAVDEGLYSPYVGAFTLASLADGPYTIKYRSADNVLNIEPEHSMTVTLDKTAPVTTIMASDPLVEGAINTVSPKTTFNFYSTDNIAGVNNIQYRIDNGGWNTFTGGFALSGAGTHTVGYRATDNLGNAEAEKALTVKLITIDITKEVSLEPVVLAGAWKYHKHEEHDDKGKHNGQGHDDDKDQPMQNLANILSASGLTYYVPKSEDEFVETLRSGRYNTYVLMDFNEHEFRDELREAVNYGDGLVYVKTQSDDDDAMSEVFGVKFKGMSEVKGLTVNLKQSLISDAGTLQTTIDEKAVRTEITSSAAQTFGYINEKKKTYPVIVYNQYGRGKVILFSFDLLNSPDQNKVKELVINSIKAVAPTEHYTRALSDAPVKITLQNASEPVDLKVTETLPVDVAADNITPDATQTSNTIQWSLSLSANQKVKLGYWLNLPDIAGQYQTSTEVTYSNLGNYRLYSNYNLDLFVVYNSTELLSQIITDLQNILPPGKKDAHKIHAVIEELSKINGNADNRKEAEKNIERITDAVKELKKVSADTSAIRLKLDELLKIWQKKWSLLQESEHHRKDKRHSWLEKFKLAYNADARLYDRQLAKMNKQILVASTGSLSGLLSSTPTNDVLYFYHTDHLGTPIMMTDKNGSKVWEAEYSPFGELLSITGTVTNNLRFSGQYYDEEAGSNYNINRTYNPNIGRYHEADPLGMSGGINRFTYSVNNPVNLIDPLGLKPCCDAQLPASPIKEVALTCFAESSNNCSQGGSEKRAITDCIYNRAAKNRKYWCGNSVVGVLSCSGQFLGYGSAQYKKAENPKDLDEKECQKLKDCMSAAQASSAGTQYSYTNFNQTNKPGRTSLCSHYFWQE